LFTKKKKKKEGKKKEKIPTKWGWERAKNCAD